MEAEGARRHRWLDAQHDSATRHRRERTNAFNADAQGFVDPGMCHCPNPRIRRTAFTDPRETTEPQIRRSGFVPMDRYECTTSRESSRTVKLVDQRTLGLMSVTVYEMQCMDRPMRCRPAHSPELPATHQQRRKQPQADHDRGGVVLFLRNDLDTLLAQLRLVLVCPFQNQSWLQAKPRGDIA